MSDDVLKMYGKGASLLMKMGYQVGKGLGENGRGIVEPIMPTIFKRGEGIKVAETNKMTSRIVDDWSDSSDDEDIDMEKKDMIPLSFNRGETFTSEHEIPELFEIIRDYRNCGTQIPIELVKKAESSKDGNDMKLRTKLWNALKLIKLNQPKLKYLEFEKNQLKSTLDIYKSNADLLEKVTQLLSESELLNIDNLLSLGDFTTVDKEILDEITKVCSAKVAESWNQRVEDCNIYDMVELGELLDDAGKTLQLNSLSKSNSVDMTILKNNYGGKDVKFVFSDLGSVIFQPLLTKLKSFYDDWNVENVNVGLGVFEEIQESGLLSSTLCDQLLVKPIIVSKICQNLKGTTITDNLRWIIKWLEVLPAYFEHFLKCIIDQYCLELTDSACTLTMEDLETSDMLYWLDIAQDDALKSQLDQAVLYYLMNRFTQSFSSVVSNTWVLLYNENINAMKSLIKGIEYFKLKEYDAIIYNELMLPFQIGYMQTYENDDDYEEFLKQLIEVLCCVGILNEYSAYYCVQEGVRQCCEHANSRKDESSSAILREDFPDSKTLLETKVVDWRKILNKSPSNTKPESRANVKVKFSSIKDVVFHKCEKYGIPIIPGGTRDGKQYYIIENKGTKYNVYFQQKIMFADYNGFSDEPIGIDQIFN